MREAMEKIRNMGEEAQYIKPNSTTLVDVMEANIKLETAVRMMTHVAALALAQDDEPGLQIPDFLIRKEGAA